MSVAEQRKREEERKNYKRKQEYEIADQLRQKAGDYLLAAYDTQRLADKSKVENVARERKLDPGVVKRWMHSLDSWEKTSNAIFAPWFAFAALTEKGYPAKAGELAAGFAAGTNSAGVNPVVARAFAGDPPTAMKDVA